MKTFKIRKGTVVGFTKKAKENAFKYALNAIDGKTDKDAREIAFVKVQEFERTEVELANKALALGYTV